ncbi:MAG: ELM1/GtrOC1 family putative glycosyltransferase [Pseudomonadota bacterium]
MVQAAAQADQADSLDRGALALRQVVVLSDGIAGHDRSSEGIVLALSRLGPVNTQWVTIKERKSRSRRLARFHAAFGPWSGQPEHFAEFDGGVPSDADFVVSTGPATAATNIALAKALKASNIYYGFPKWPVLGITVLLSPLPHSSRNVVRYARPSIFDADSVPEPRPFDRNKPWMITVLFGGDSKHYSYSDNDLICLTKTCLDVANSGQKIHMKFFDSRRTNQQQFIRFAEQLRSNDHIEVYFYRDGGLGFNQEAFQSDVVIVTADSMSMISEAIAAGRPTFVAASEHYEPPSRDERELRQLADAGYIKRGTFSDIDLSVLSSLPVPKSNLGSHALARILQERGFGMRSGH